VFCCWLPGWLPQQPQQPAGGRRGRGARRGAAPVAGAAAVRGGPVCARAARRRAGEHTAVHQHLAHSKDAGHLVGRCGLRQQRGGALPVPARWRLHRCASRAGHACPAVACVRAPQRLSPAHHCHACGVRGAVCRWPAFVPTAPSTPLLRARCAACACRVRVPTGRGLFALTCAHPRPSSSSGCVVGQSKIVHPGQGGRPSAWWSSCCWT